MWTVSLQCRRLRSIEPEDTEFVLRRWADFELLVVALIRLRRAATIVLAASQTASQLRASIAAFDQTLPGIKIQRDVTEHIDEYAIDSPKRHHKSVTRQALEVGVIDESHFSWLGRTLSVPSALSAAESLFQAIQSATKSFAIHG